MYYMQSVGILVLCLYVLVHRPEPIFGSAERSSGQCEYRTVTHMPEKDIDVGLVEVFPNALVETIVLSGFLIEQL